MLNWFNFIAFIIALLAIGCTEDCGCDYEFNITYKYVDGPQEQIIKEPVKQITEEPVKEPDEQIIEEPQEQITETPEDIRCSIAFGWDHKNSFELVPYDIITNERKYLKHPGGGLIVFDALLYANQDRSTKCESTCDCPESDICLVGSCLKLTDNDLHLFNLALCIEQPEDKPIENPEYY